MACEDLPGAKFPSTSEIPFLSSLHGRQRRSLRKIDRRDLQAAVKHGKKEPGWPHPATGAARWKYTHANIVYITDETSTREVTSYAEPIAIPRAGVTLEHVREHKAAKERMRNDPSLSTSHTVIVVDQSGSMRTCDIFDFKNRSKAVWGMLALDFVATQRLSGEATDTDIVSVVLMGETSEVIISREPINLILYNKFVGLHDDCTPRSHGNFIPALDKAKNVLLRHVHGGCALTLLFLSDGKPSDHCTRWNVFEYRYITQEETLNQLTDRVRELAAMFGQQLTVVTLGFGHPGQDFSALEAMAEAAKECGAQAAFHRPEPSSEGLASALAHTVSSLTATKQRLTTLAAGSGVPRELRKVSREAAGTPWGYEPTTTSTTDGWVIYTEGVHRVEFSWKALRWNGNPWVPVDFFSNNTNGIAIRKNALGEGAERLVFGLQEIDTTSSTFVGPKLVAKESKYVGGEYSKIAFHEVFAKTQLKAERFAKKFNARIKKRLSLISPGQSFSDLVWDVSFLPCSVYVFFEEGASMERGVLVEKLLEPSSCYTKFNGNNGYVHDARDSATTPPVANKAQQGLGSKAFMEAILEEDDEEYDSDDASSTHSVEDHNGPGEELGNERKVSAFPRGAPSQSNEQTDVAAGISSPISSFSPKAECYVQAFSHFTYWNSRRKMLVCDLQGVKSACPDKDRAGVFELTDPVIHYRSKSGRSQVYGRTDLGKRGIHSFFETHECNDVCRLLGLSR